MRSIGDVVSWAGFEMRRFSESEGSRAGQLRRRHARSASILLELIVSIPVLFLGTLAVFEFALLGLALQLVSTAAIEGVRSGALVGGSTTSVQATVEQILGVQGISLANGAAVRIEGVSLVGTATTFGDGTVTPLTVTGPAEGDLAANEVRVTVAVKALIANNRPVPNWLNGMGFNLGNRVIHHSALLTIE